MYFKDNNKTGKSFFGYEISFPFYEFSKIQHWLEVGQKLQNIFNLHQELNILLDDLDSKHGPILQKKHDKTTGFVDGSAKPIRDIVKPEEIKFISRLIEQFYNKDLPLILRIYRKIEEMRPYQNLKELSKFYENGDTITKQKIEEYFDYLILDSFRKNLLELWDAIRKSLDDKANEIEIPEPSVENREFFHYFLQSRDSYCEDNNENGLGIVRKAIEDILTRLWILHFKKFNDVNLNKLLDLDNLPGFLKNKGILNEQEVKEVMPFIKYGNAGVHIKGEISKENLDKNGKLMINNGINFVNNLCKKYVKLMKEKGYCNIEFTKTGISVGIGDFYKYVCRKETDSLLSKRDIEEFK